MKLLELLMNHMIPFWRLCIFLFTSLAENTPIRAQSDGSDAVEIDFNDIITAKTI